MNYTAIILAAGFGDRLQELTKEPKSLLQINGKSLIEWHIRHLNTLNFNKIIIIVGYKSDILKTHVESLNFNNRIEFIQNNDFRNKGNAYSMYLGLLKTAALEDLLVIDADLIYENKVIYDYMKDKEGDSILIGEGSLEDIECAKALIDDKGFIRKTIDKRLVDNDELKKYKFIGEAIGMIRFSKFNRLNILNKCELFFKNSDNLKLNWEHLMNEYFLDNLMKSFLSTSNYWIEIDTKQDYSEAKKLFNNINVIDKD